MNDIEYDSLNRQVGHLIKASEDAVLLVQELIKMHNDLARRVEKLEMEALSPVVFSHLRAHQ